MTKKWSNLNLPGALHYVTGNVLHRIPIFKQERCCKGFLMVPLIESGRRVLKPCHFGVSE
jgi:hypothetical protein